MKRRPPRILFANDDVRLVFTAARLAKTVRSAANKQAHAPFEIQIRHPAFRMSFLVVLENTLHPAQSRVRQSNVLLEQPISLCSAQESFGEAISGPKFETVCQC